jgi:hypothetical protein
MPNFSDIISRLKTLRELELDAIRDQAESPLYINIIGAAGTGKSTLIQQLLSGPGVHYSLTRDSLSLQRLIDE